MNLVFFNSEKASKSMAVSADHFRWTSTACMETAFSLTLKLVILKRRHEVQFYEICSGSSSGKKLSRKKMFKIRDKFLGVSETESNTKEYSALRKVRLAGFFSIFREKKLIRKSPLT